MQRSAPDVNAIVAPSGDHAGRAAPLFGGATVYVICCAPLPSGAAAHTWPPESTNASDRPSGDHDGPPLVVTPSGIGAGVPPAAGTVASPPGVAYAIVVPSGDQAGMVEPPARSVSCTAEPSARPRTTICMTPPVERDDGEPVAVGRPRGVIAGADGSCAAGVCGADVHGSFRTKASLARSVDYGRLGAGAEVLLRSCRGSTATSDGSGSRFPLA